MKLTFKAPLFKEWSLTDDSIIFGRETIPLSKITKVNYTPNTSKLKNGVVQIFVGSDFYTLPFPYKQNDDGDKAAKYILEHYGK